MNSYQKILYHKWRINIDCSLLIVLVKINDTKNKEVRTMGKWGAHSHSESTVHICKEKHFTGGNFLLYPHPLLPMGSVCPGVNKVDVQ